MKTKKILLKPSSQFYEELISTAKQMDRGTKPTKLRGDYFESLEAVRNLLTEKRLELWRFIRDQAPSSILALSKLVKRDFKSVYRDVTVLVSVGLIELRKTKGPRGDQQRPVSLADSLQLEVA